MKPLFDEHDHYTDTGRGIDHEAGIALRPIMEKWAKEGYSVRQIAYILHMTIDDLTLGTIISAERERYSK